MADLTDNKLIKLIADGDRVALNKLYHLHSKKVYNLALNFTNNVKDAEEITQDVFIKVYQNAKYFKGKSTFSTWIYRITVNLSLNSIKKNKKFSHLPLDQIIEIKDIDHPGILLENKEKNELLFAAIDTLSKSQRTAFILGFIENLPRAEVAEIMKTSVKSIESLLQRAKKNLRSKLGNYYKK